MKKFLVILVLAGIPGIAQAQSSGFCPEGRTSSGSCVNTKIADDVRTSAIVLSQPKLSFTGPPVLSNIDGTYTIPQDRSEIGLNHRVKRR